MRAETRATVGRWLSRAFLLLVAVLLVRLGREVDWAAAWQALQALPAGVLWAAGGLSLLSHALYSSYDLIGRHQTHHGLPAWRSAAVGFMSYAFNLNLGALVGGVAFRYKLYASLGLEATTVTRVLLLSMLTNWLGYLALGGLVLLLAPPALPPQWGVPAATLPTVGGAMLLAAAGYVLACALASGRSASWRGHSLTLPSFRVALLQLLLAACSWALIATVVWTLLQQRLPYPLVLGALLTAAVAGVITHVPAGLGVLEAVFLALLGAQLPQAELLGALLAYRALYYLLPLALAAVLLASGRVTRSSARGWRALRNPARCSGALGLDGAKSAAASQQAR